MSQADGYVRIVTQNDVSEAQRSTEQLGDTIQEERWIQLLQTT